MKYIIIIIMLLAVAGCNSTKKDIKEKTDELKDDAKQEIQDATDRLLDRDYKPDEEEFEIQDDVDPALIRGKIGSCRDQSVMSWQKEYPAFHVEKHGIMLHFSGVDSSTKGVGKTADLFATVYIFWWVGDHLEGRSYEHMRKSMGARGTDFGNTPIKSGDEVFTMLSGLNRDPSHGTNGKWRTKLFRLKLDGPLQAKEGWE